MTRDENDTRYDEEIVTEVREFYRGLMTPKYQWSRHNNAEFFARRESARADPRRAEVKTFTIIVIVLLTYYALDEVIHFG